MDTVLAVWLATNSFEPFGVMAIPRGSVPTGISATTVKASGPERETTETVPSSAFVT